MIVVSHSITIQLSNEDVINQIVKQSVVSRPLTRCLPFSVDTERGGTVCITEFMSWVVVVKL